MSKTVRVAVTGAAGQIGYSLLPRLASGEVFGADTKIILHLIEIEPALPALEGVAMELNDCAFPLLEDMVLTADLNKGFDGVNWALLVGSKPRGKGMERGDLIKTNGPIFTAQGEAISNTAADDVRVVVVGNPCNTNALIAMNNAGDVPNERFSALTRLDENRAKAQLAAKAGVPVTAVTNMAIWGNHSATQYPDAAHAKINGRPVMDVISDHAWLQGEFITTVQKRGAAIIQARGKSSAFSAASATLDHVRAFLNPTPAGDWHSAAIPSDGSYGIDAGLIFSFPVSTKADGSYEIVQGLEFDEFAKGKVQATLDELRGEREAVADLL